MRASRLEPGLLAQDVEVDLGRREEQITRRASSGETGEYW